jgi:hypothetical protein
MAQTTGAMSMRNCVVEYCTNTAWTDISGVANQVNPSGYERESGEAFTGASDDAVITIGKNSPLELEVMVVYTESSAEGFELLRAIKEAGTPVRVRWVPKGIGTTGNFKWTTGTGYLTAAPAPGGELGGGAPILATIAGKFPNVTGVASTTAA